MKPLFLCIFADRWRKIFGLFSAAAMLLSGCDFSSSPARLASDSLLGELDRFSPQEKCVSLREASAQELLNYARNAQMPTSLRRRAIEILGACAAVTGTEPIFALAEDAALPRSLAIPALRNLSLATDKVRAAAIFSRATSHKDKFIAAEAKHQLLEFRSH